MNKVNIFYCRPIVFILVASCSFRVLEEEERLLWQMNVPTWPTLAEGIPKSDRHVESFLGDRVTDSIFLNPVTDEELLNIVHNAKDKKSKGYDGIDVYAKKNHSAHPNTIKTYM